MSKLNLSGIYDKEEENESASTSASSQSASKMKLRRGSRSTHRSTVTYRLNVETIDKIEELSIAARKSINETVQELLDLAIANTEVE
jgi:hypothetical protein